VIIKELNKLDKMETIRYNFVSRIHTFFTITAIIFAIFLSNGNYSYAQTTKTVGTSGDYATLGAAFDAINSGSLTGAITLQIISSITETGTDSLIASGSGPANFSSVLIYPTGSGYTISGNIYAPLIALNGSDNVTIDGRVNQTGSKDLIITNESNSSIAGTSTVRFINDATYNTIKYCTIKGSTTDITGGVVFFGYTNASLGNSNNTIENNDITNASDANRPINTVYSKGTLTFMNASNTISNNNVYDFFNRSYISYGIKLDSNNTSWTISGNSFYETNSFATTGNTNAYFSYTVIYINSPEVGYNFNVNNNYIGGSSPQCGSGGSVPSWTKTNTYNNAFTGIYIFAGSGAGSETNVQGNTINNFTYANSGDANFYGINIESGAVNVGTTSGNIIGSPSGTGSITYSCGPIQTINDGYYFGWKFYGIYTYYSSGTVKINCQNNTISSITTTNDATTNATSIYGIYFASGGTIFTISNNTIGSITTANSINASSASSGTVQFVFGIFCDCNAAYNTISGNTIANLTNGTTNTDTTSLGCIHGIQVYEGTTIITNNIIRNLTIANANTDAAVFNSVCGIRFYTNSGFSSAVSTISGNTIYNLSNTYTAFTGSVTGIYYTGSPVSSNVSNNFIHSFTVNAASTSATFYGIKISAGATTYSNNIISLGGNTQTTIYGIYETGSTSYNNNLYFNTIYISGTPSTGALFSYALYSALTTNTRNFRNNIFYNSRSNNGATGKHFSIYFAYTVNTNLTINYNDYFATGTGGMLGYHSDGVYDAANDISTLDAWKTATGQDGASLNSDPIFTGGTTASNYSPSASLPGVPGTGILGDYFDNRRDAVSPEMGAIETTSAPLNIVEVYIGAVLQASYTNIKTAFDRINDGTHQGNLILKITGNQFLTSSAVLNASGTGNANYSAISIYPSSTGLAIGGDVSGAPLIDLNGAANVTFDGRVGATGSAKDLTIQNMSISIIEGTSTVRFINDADNNTIKYCNIRGASRDTSGGMVFFSTTTGNKGIKGTKGIRGTTGNNNNTIDNNNITNSSDANRPVNLIYSSGTSGAENSGNTISNNYIYDFFNRDNVSSSAGIYLSNNTTACSITGNSFYETNTFAPNFSSTLNVIRITNSSGNNFTISNNYIGGTSPNCGKAGIDTSWTKTNYETNIFYAINIQAGTTTASNVQGNTIKNFTYANFRASNWYGINIASGAVNVGTTTGNTIGDTTGTGSISYNGYSSDGSLYGICITTDGTVDCRNNNIGSITTGINSSNSTNIYGIYKSGSGTTTINNNLIGSTVTANSINASSYSTQIVYGINSAGTGTVSISGNTINNLRNGIASSETIGLIQGVYISGGTNTITNNIVTNLTSTNVNANSDASVSAGGIIFNSTTPAVQTISNNIISGLSNTNTGSVIGLYYNGGTTESTVNGNFINSLVTSSSGFSTNRMIYGIKMNAGKTTYSNNVISLGGNPRATLVGIYETGALSNDNNLYFNTIYLGGTADVMTGKTPYSWSSYALYSAVTTNTRNFRNNIFVNERINRVASTGKHYAAYFSANPSGTSLTIDYNDYYAPGVNGGKFGYFNGADVTTLAAWKTATGQDVNSNNINPQFPPADTTISGYKPGAYMTGVTIEGLPNDYSGYTRTIPPTLGAIQYDNPMPVSLSQFTYSINLRDVILNWRTSSEVNNKGFNIERKSTENGWQKIGFVAGKGIINAQSSYTFNDTKLNTGKYQYRLKQIDNNGNFEYHNLNGEVEVGIPAKYELSQNYPNPFNPTTKIDFALPNDSKISIKVYDMTGREVMNIMNNELKTAGYYTIKINPSMLSSGLYFYRLIADKFVQVKKMVLLK
jgi:hypothetical protein